jgi:nitrogen fixation/metabolism regulation signal transduction histidine kinase
MTVRWRLALLVLLATGVPVLTGVLVTRQLVRETLAVGLNPQLDAALEAGVRQARGQFQAQRAGAEQTVRVLAARWPEGGGEAAAAARFDSLLAGSDRLVLRGRDGATRTLRAGALPPPESAAPAHAPPAAVSATATLADGRSLELTRPLRADWRDDALALAESLQMVRGLRLQRAELERMYGLGFLATFLLALVVGLTFAWRLGRGIVEPVQSLVQGTEAVAAGRRDVQVPVRRGDELGRLAERFNSMVRTLDLQGRRLVDLEKMEGWREMARALAHEVKNPLTPIQLTVEEMRARYPGGDKEYEALLSECARIVSEEVESLRSVVHRFREFSRPVALEPAPTDLGRLVGDVAALQRDLRAETTIESDLDPVAVDADRLRQVLMNLAANAREACREVAEPRLAMTLSATDTHVVITVEDNGPGVPPDQRERVFEPYRSGKAGGLGLGLALVKGIVLAHGGDITVDAGRWRGARFTITLPRTGAPRPEENHG